MLLTVVGGGDCMEGGTTTGKGRHATQVELRLAFDTSHTFLTLPQASGLSDLSADHDKSRIHERQHWQHVDEHNAATTSVQQVPNVQSIGNPGPGRQPERWRPIRGIGRDPQHSALILM